MGGVVSVLVCLLCRNGCSASNTASELLFFPPTPPCYKIVPKGGSNDGEEDFDFVLDEMLEQVIFEGGPQVVKVKTRRKKTVVVLWYKSPYARYTLLHSHGNATDLGAMHDRYVGLVQNLGVSVVAYDYTGYGASSGGHPTEKDTCSDIEAVYQWVTTHCRAREVLAAAGMDTGVSNIPGSNVLLYGQSVGSGPTCYLASRQRCAGVILHSPILSGMRVLTESRALGCLDVYPNIERIRKVNCPVMVIHGKLDTEVHWEHGRRLHESTPDTLKREPWWPEDCGHNDIGESQDNLAEYYTRLRAFVASLDTTQR